MAVNTNERNELLKSAMEAESEIMRLHEEMEKKFQKVIDLDIAENGKVSDATLSILETFHYTVVDNVLYSQQYVENWEKSKQIVPEAVEQTREGLKVITQDTFYELLAQHQKLQQEGKSDLLDLSGCYFESVSFRAGIYQDIDFAGSRFERCDFQEVAYKSVGFRETEFMSCKIFNSEFDNSAFQKATFYSTEIVNTQYRSCYFDESIMVASVFNQSMMYDSRFIGTMLHNTQFEETMVNNCQIENINFADSEISYTQSFIEARVERQYEMEVTSMDVTGTFEMQLRIVEAEEIIREESLSGNYNLGSHVISDIGPIQDGETRSLLDMLKNDIDRKLSAYEFWDQEHTEPEIMIRYSESNKFQAGEVYDFKAFNEKIAYYNDKLHESNNIVEYEKVGFILRIPDADNQQAIYHEMRYDIGDEKGDVVALLRNMSSITPEIVHYLEERIVVVAIESTEEVQTDLDATNTSETIQSKEEKTQESQQERSYLPYSAFAYSDSKNPTKMHGNSTEEILTKLQEWNTRRTEEKQFKSCYVNKFNSGTGKYEQVAKYDVKTGADITPIYLQIPPMGREEFLETVKQIKSNGARYYSAKKSFYITRSDDISKFAEYLPEGIEVPQVSAMTEKVMESTDKKIDFSIEPGKEYYDNRVLIKVEGMQPVNIYGDDYDVHFPSLSEKETRDIIERLVLPNIELKAVEQSVMKEFEYNGQKFDKRQFEVIQKALEQNFTTEQIQLIANPSLSSGQMSEIRFAFRDGLSVDQVKQFATPDHEQWQMDFCRIGMQHGLVYENLKQLISAEGVTKDNWPEKRQQLSEMIKSHEHKANKTRIEGKESLLDKLSANKDKINAAASQEKLAKTKQEEINR